MKEFNYIEWRLQWRRTETLSHNLLNGGPLVDDLPLGVEPL